jgi:flagellar assembly protein FliH
LALLQEQETQASFDSNLSAPKTSASVNEHLPFVMDDYAAARRIKVLLAKGLLDKKNVGRFVDDRDISDSADTNDDLKTAQSHLEATQEALDAITAESSGQSTEEQIDEPEVQAEAKGIPLEEVVQREEAQFSKGLAQGIEEGKAEGFEAGKAQGLEEGKGQGLEEAVQEALEKGKAQGLEEGISRGIEQGERQAREAMGQEVATQCEVLSQVSEGLHDLLQDPQRFFNPLKRLALNMAQHIAKHEISISPHAIDALVQNCLNELDHPIKGAVVVELNPQDKKLLETLTTASLQGVHLEAVPQLASGSVRVIANDMVVEDLIENRLEALTRSLALKEVTSRAEPVVETNKNPETEVQEASIELSEEASPEASPEAPEELSFEPTSEVDEQIKKDDGEAEDVHS